MLLRPPGVYRPQQDTTLLIEVMRGGGYAGGRTVLDVGTGTGTVAIAAARAGATSVTAVDLSLRSTFATWCNSRLNRAGVTVRRGDLFAPVSGRHFGLVLANPPYVPSGRDKFPRHRMARCWDGGRDGRRVIDRICSAVPGMLSAHGLLLLVQSAVSGEQATLARLAEGGLAARVVTRARIPFGPVLRAREAMLRAAGHLPAGQTYEEITVIEARRGG